VGNAKFGRHGGRNVASKFKGVVAREELVVALRPTAGVDGGVPLLSGVEIIVEEIAEKK